ncbi:hypothetical protein BC830DRAFT_1110874 [Chytriomyces sp. MP71]|nr:hypothetical protein BC830DRAFT_1110874 [Chytriomyces sp. MP71]
MSIVGLTTSPPPSQSPALRVHYDPRWDCYYFVDPSTGESHWLEDWNGHASYQPPPFPSDPLQPTYTDPHTGRNYFVDAGRSCWMHEDRKQAPARPVGMIRDPEPTTEPTKPFLSSSPTAMWPHCPPMSGVPSMAVPKPQRIQGSTFPAIPLPQATLLSGSNDTNDDIETVAADSDYELEDRGETVLRHELVHAKTNFKCAFFPYLAATEEGLKTQADKHTEGATYECLRCTQMFVNRKHLMRHVSTVHSTEKQFVCALCGAKFRQSTSLNRHKVTHANDRPFKCGLCPHSSTTSYNLKAHILTHSGARPFPCDECSYAASTAGNLKIHKRVHTGERPYKCEECGAAFTQPNTLKSHKQTHLVEKPFTCACGRGFKKETTLMNHRTLCQSARVTQRCD